ncbi:MAG: 30S ribosomal protein S6e [Candidatus Altiarchaeota archaeon]|nr:30S ribosomal protein S6e [Candidatus Altiarchaeota archaeon]
MRLVIGSKDGNTKQLALDEGQSKLVKGLKIGEKFKGELVGLQGYELEIKGGADKEGFPMRRDLPGSNRRRVLLSSGTGYKPKQAGIRKKKMIRGNTVDTDISQLNVFVTKKGKKSLNELIKKEESDQSSE